ncbi:MAG: 2OG-Fe(II) oxygenase [Acidimicrobiia bacterium]
MIYSEQRSDTVVDWTRLETQLPELAESHRNASPFPFTILDDFLVPGAAEQAAAEFPDRDGGWMAYVHWNERKYANTMPETWTPLLRDIVDELQSPRFVSYLEKLSGIDNLICDETLEGAGLHQTRRDGFLNVHADFTVHPKRRTWRRRLNLILFLNEDWPPEWGGSLELWAKDMSRAEHTVAPVLNRAVIFDTSADSFHGYPDALTCPEERTRCSVALYYYTEEAAPVVRSTEYRARPGERMRAIPIFLDKTALRVYDALKRHLKISDAGMSRILRKFDRRSRENTE